MNKIFSIVIPARNEEKHLPTCFSSIVQSMAYLCLNDRNIHEYCLQNSVCPKDLAEIIVVVNRCEDRTEEVARDFGATIVYSNEKNLSKIRNAGIFAATSSYVITIDADSRMSKNMLLKVKQALDNPKIVGGGVMIYPERYSLGIIMTGITLLPLALLWRITCGLFYFRKEDGVAINGFNEELVSVEDVDFARRLKALGEKGVMLNGSLVKRSYKNLFFAYIVTSCRKFDKFGDWFFIKNIRESYRLFFGKDQELANKIWYDFKN